MRRPGLRPAGSSVKKRGSVARWSGEAEGDPLEVQLDDGNTADIDGVEDIDLDTEVVYFEGQRLAGAQA